MEEKTNRLMVRAPLYPSGGTVRIRVTSFLLFSFAKFAASFMKGIYGAKIKEDIYDYFERSYCERFGIYQKEKNSKRLETIEEFMRMNMHYAEVIRSHEELKFRTDSVAGSLRSAAQKSGLPVRVAQRGKKIFLVRTDM